MILPCSGAQERYEADYLKKHKEMQLRTINFTYDRLSQRRILCVNISMIAR